MEQKIIDFLKGLMQPFLTIAMVVIFIAYSLSGKFTPDQVWQVVVGIIVFWFGYTAFKFGTPEKTETPKADSPLGSQGSVQKSFGTTSTAAYVTPFYAPDVPSDPEAPTVDEAINEIASDSEPEDATGMAQKFKDKMIYWWEALSIPDRQKWLDYAISLAKHAWQVMIGDTIKQDAPTSYKQMEPENLYYGRLKKACGDKWNPTGSRGAIDVYHDLLKFKQTGQW